MQSNCTPKQIFKLTRFIAAFGKADRRNISYRSSWSSVKFDTRTLQWNMDIKSCMKQFK